MTIRETTYASNSLSAPKLGSEYAKKMYKEKKAQHEKPLSEAAKAYGVLFYSFFYDESNI